MKTHKCKEHRYGHAYSRCAACQHEYCARIWESCPRCSQQRSQAATYQPSNLEDLREKMREEIANTGDT